jgi:hypothetical protein
MPMRKPIAELLGPITPATASDSDPNENYSLLEDIAPSEPKATTLPVKLAQDVAKVIEM